VDYKYRAIMLSILYVILIISFAVLLSVTTGYAKTDAEKLEDIYEKVGVVYNRTSILLVHGTEYVSGETGTIFLQLKDENGVPINNATCNLDIYYPSISHSNFLSDAPMVDFKNGIYYYDLTVPNQTGVYMIDASCSYLFSNYWYYRPDYPPYLGDNMINITVIKGIVTGSALSLNEKNDGLYIKHVPETGSGKTLAEATYKWNVSVPSDKTIQSVSLYYLGESTSGNTLHFYVWNNSYGKWDKLPNSLTFHGTVQQSGLPTGLDEFVSNSIVPSYVYNGTVKILLNTTSSGTFDMWHNWMNLKIGSVGNYIADVKGAGEMHVGVGCAFALDVTEDLNKLFAKITSLTLKSNHDYCISNTTLVKELTYTYCIDNQCSEFRRNETVPCDYGCAGNSCVSSTVERLLMVAGIIAFLLVLVAVLWRFRLVKGA
jgi:hypothetical protein